MKHNTDTLWTGFIGGTYTSVAYLVGGIDNLVIALAIFMACDYITGVISGLQGAGVSSKRAFKGLGKKAAMLIMVIIANQLDVVTGNDTHFMRNAMIMFLIGTEGISLTENLGRLGIIAPRFLSNTFEQFKERNDKDVRK